MLTNQQLTHLQHTLTEQKMQLSKQLNQFSNDLTKRNASENVGELSIYDNHPADMGTELFEREKDFALNEHSESELEKINSALKAIQEGNYGICKSCGQPIPFERLEAVPTTQYCVEHTPERNVPQDRPVEESILKPANDNSFHRIISPHIRDFRDSFQEVARFGTSETPADFEGDFRHYDELYDEQPEE